MVGPHCAVRVQLYHMLWHYKHKLRAKLLKALKNARAVLKARQPLCTCRAAFVSQTEPAKIFLGSRSHSTAVVTLMKKPCHSNRCSHCGKCTALVQCDD